MSSSKADEEGPKQRDLVEGSAGTSVPKMTDETAGRSEAELIFELIRAGDRESLLRAFQTDPWRAGGLIAALAQLGEAEWMEYATTLIPTLMDVLIFELPPMDESRFVGEVGPELEQQSLVRINLERAIASLLPEPCGKGWGIDLMLTEAVGLRREVRLAVITAVAMSFEIVDLLPSFLMFLQGVAVGYDQGVLPRQPRSAQILTADSVQQQPMAPPEGSEIDHGIHRNTRKRESESTSPFRVLPGGNSRP